MIGETFFERQLIQLASLGRPMGIIHFLKTRRLIVVGATLLSTGIFAAMASFPDAFSGTYGPVALIKVAKPLITWEVWSPTLEVSKVEMLIDGQEVPAQYHADSRAIEYEPTVPLRSGIHPVLARITFGAQTTFSKKWDITVASDALAEFPPANEQQLLALEVTNRYRTRMHLPAMEWDNRLSMAALAHINYLVDNNLTGHLESASKPGYVAPSGGERCEIFGWCAGSWEGVTYGEAKIPQLVQDLFDAPYHRLPFMQPGHIKLGAAYKSKHMTMEFGASSLSSTVTSPADGEQDVPCQWECHEHPNPIKMHSNLTVVGYPIMVASFARKEPSFLVESADLKDAKGNIVPTWLNTPENDPNLTTGLIIIPQSPLKANTTYEAHAVVTVNEERLERIWHFTTR